MHASDSVQTKRSSSWETFATSVFATWQLPVAKDAELQVQTERLCVKAVQHAWLIMSETHSVSRFKTCMSTVDFTVHAIHIYTYIASHADQRRMKK